MTLQEAAPASVDASTRRSIARLGWAGTGLALLGLGVAALLNASTGPEGRIAKYPSADEHLPGRGLRANEPLWGVEHWALWIQLLSVAGSTIVITTFAVLSWRRRAMHPAVPVVIALFGVSLLDPFANWCSSAAMNPQLLHYPVDWPYANISPTVQPLVNNLVYPYLFLFPALFVAAAWKRRLLRGPDGGGWLRRHPRCAVFGFSYLISLPVNLVRGGPVHGAGRVLDLHPDPELGGGTCRVQLAVPVDRPPGPVHRDRRRGGLSVARRRWAQPGQSDRRPVPAVSYPPHLLGEVLVASLFLSLSYMAYNGLWATFRLTDSADQVAQPWPYQDTKVYDPKGDYRSAGVPGPYYAGIWP